MRPPAWLAGLQNVLASFVRRIVTLVASIEWVGLQPALDVGKGGSGLALRWPSGANTPHQRAQPGSPRTHTRHARHQTKGWSCWLYPTPWIPVCVARVVWRAKAIQPRARRGARTPPGTWAGRPGRGPGGVDTLVIRLWGFGVNPPRLCRSAKSQVLPERAQVLLVPTAAAASFLYSPDRKRQACGH